MPYTKEQLIGKRVSYSITQKPLTLLDHEHPHFISIRCEEQDKTVVYTVSYVNCLFEEGLWEFVDEDQDNLLQGVKAALKSLEEYDTLTAMKILRLAIEKEESK
jgi:hypothetical protein